MLVVWRKYMFQTEAFLLRRLLFYSSSWNGEHNQQELMLNSNDNLSVQQESKKLLKVALLGLPNVGKSTLVNKLARRSVCPTSSKINTTTHKSDAVYSEGSTQIIFMDTPGLVTSEQIKKFKLDETFKNDPKSSIKEADVIGIIQDVTNVSTRHKFTNAALNFLKLRRDDALLLLIFNKVDKLKKKHVLLDLTRLLTTNEDYPKFDDIFMISALNGDGVNDLRNYLLDSAKDGDWKYEKDLYSDQSFEKIIAETVRAKMLDVAFEDIPYTIKVNTEHLDIGEDGTINAVVVLDCRRKNHVSILLSRKALMIKTAAKLAEQELRHAFRTPVILKLSVVCTKAQQE